MNISLGVLVLASASIVLVAKSGETRSGGFQQKPGTLTNTYKANVVIPLEHGGYLELSDKGLRLLSKKNVCRAGLTLDANDTPALTMFNGKEEPVLRLGVNRRQPGASLELLHEPKASQVILWASKLGSGLYLMDGHNRLRAMLASTTTDVHAPRAEREYRVRLRLADKTDSSLFEAGTKSR